jgi:hypothetical protein
LTHFKLFIGLFRVKDYCHSLTQPQHNLGVTL